MEETCRNGNDHSKRQKKVRYRRQNINKICLCTGTILQQFEHHFSIFGACTLDAQIKDLCACVWKKNLNSL